MRILAILLLCLSAKAWACEKLVIVCTMEKCSPCALWKANLTEWGIKYFLRGESADISHYPTTIIVCGGKEICRFSGMKTKQELAEMLK